MPKKNNVTVFLNGIFDCFHDGHKAILNKALKFAERGQIVIALNSDAWARKHKGEGRPKDKYEERVRKISRYVTEWCLKYYEYPGVKFHQFETEEELYNLIKQSNPDCLIKGDDYKDKAPSCITGSDICSVLILSSAESPSIRTSKILEDGESKAFIPGEN